uniref:PA n=1 Tax=Mason Creek virus TaxID=2651593 RepID=A0A5P8HZK0_9VIRU|nr:PA [Mason Creek virus]
MTSETFRDYLSKTYLKDAVAEIETKFPEYHKMDSTKKDKVLRKFHVICNLINTIKISESTEMEISGIKRKLETDLVLPANKRVKREDIAREVMDIIEYEEPESPTYRAESPVYEAMNSPGSPSFMDFENFDMDALDNPTVSVIEAAPTEDDKYRFYCPLLLGIGPASLMLKLQKNGIVVDDSFSLYEIDIVDRETSKIIFLTEKNRDATIAQLFDKYGEFINPSQIGIVKVDYTKATCTLENCTGLNVDAAVNFLSLRRKHLVEIYSEIDIPEVIEEEVIADYVKEKRDAWVSKILLESNKEEQMEFTEEELNLPPSFPTVTISDAIEHLEDIFETRKGLPEAHWSGKILPYTCTNSFTLEEEITDTEVLSEYFPHGSVEVLHEKGKDTKDLLNFLEAMSKVIIAKKEKNNLTSFSVMQLGKTQASTMALNGVDEKTVEALRAIGWKRKGVKVDPTTPGLKQKEYPNLSKKAYPNWMKEVFHKETEESGTVCLHNITFDESEPNHPIDEISIKCCKKMKEIFTKTNMAITTALYMNLCSRLGGAYLINITSKSKSYSSVAAIPILANVETNGKKQKILTGFVFRGPHHVRDSADKINLVTIERVKDNPVEMYKKGLLVRINGEKWFIAKNAVSRMTPTYGTYLHDLLFIPTNYIGDMIFNIFQDFQEMMRDTADIIEANSDFLRHRMMEMTLMGLLGTNQEEGYFAGYRMLFMVLLELSRGNSAALIEKEGFFESINECVISNSYVLFLHGNLLHTLRHIEENRSKIRQEVII